MHIDREYLEDRAWSMDFDENVLLLNTKDQQERHDRKIELKIWKNLAALVVGIGILTMGINPIDDLQGSLNVTEELGVSSLGIKYGTMILASLLTNVYLIRKLGPKWTIVMGALLSCTYIGANFYPSWPTMVPMTMIAGFGISLVSTAMSIYLAQMAIRLAQLTSDNQEELLARVFGIKGMVTYFFTALGGLIAFMFLDMSSSFQIDFPKERYSVCGPSYCNEGLLMNSLNTELTFSPDLDDISMYGLCGFCLAVAFFAVAMLGISLYSLSALDIMVEPNEDESDSSCGLFLATMRLWKNSKLLFLIPISVVYGFKDAFWRVEFSKAYVTCALGIHYVDFSFILYNVTAMFSSGLFGKMGNHRRRLMAFPLLVFMDIVGMVCLLYWHPSANDLTLTLVATGISGITCGGLNTLLLAFYGMVFPDRLEVAYSNMYFWTFLGSTLMYVCSFRLCLKVKVVVILTLMMIGVCGYVITEILLDDDEMEKLNLKAKEIGRKLRRRMLVPAGF